MSNHVRAALLGATALIVGAGVPALAQTASPAATRSVAPPPGGPMRAGGLMRADANRDGVVTREEAIADADRRFAEIDSDRDGTISRDERRAARAARRGPPPVGTDGAAPPPPDANDAPPPRPGARRVDRPRRMMQPQTREEARARALRMFDRADTNGDGRVDRQEIEAMRLLMRARMSDGARRDMGQGDMSRGDMSPRDMPPGDEQP